ncbi:hypothetical protein ONS95_014332 [Cadophora gregata]|uniref:uncharacterized protein n=1 Tax=Cadophora gregata TaxID=51156 RepID=UPI0026DCF474|nr:uncharacterized protein ONS95_014332 [Cadophora gregata]KAK0112588.1 hypothetical protein ONS95_014332 [Cadophora gregata]
MSASDNKTEECTTEERVESLDRVSDDEENIKIHATTYIAVAAICFLALSQLVIIIGSGLLAQAMGTLFGDVNNSVWFSSIILIESIALMPVVG